MVDSQYIHAQSKETFSVENPYDGSVVTANVEAAGKEDINLAVASAEAALTTGPWATFTGTQRASCMQKLADLVEKNAEHLAYLESISMGRPITTLLGMDIPHMANCYRCKIALPCMKCSWRGPY